MKKHSIACGGIDTGKRKLDVALNGSSDRLQVANVAAGHGEVSAWLRRHKIRRVGIEASGGYERAVVARLRCNGFEVIVFQPAQVRAYAKFHLQRAKNDKIARFKNYRESCGGPQLRQFWQEEIKRFHGLFRKELKQLVAAIRQHRDLSERLDLIVSIDGIALRTATPSWCV